MSLKTRLILQCFDIYFTMGYSKLLSSVRLFQRFKYNRLGQRTCCNLQLQNDSKNNTEDIKLDNSKKGLVLGVYEENKKFVLTPAAEEINQKSDGKICKYLNELSCQMKLGKAFIVTGLQEEYSAIALSCLGPKDPGYNQLEDLDETRENVRWCVGAGVRLLQDRGCGLIEVDPAGVPDAAAEAAELAAWRFQEFKSCGNKLPSSRVSMLGAGGVGGAEAWARGSQRGSAQNWARYLSDMPANMMAPVDLAQAALDVLCPLGVQVEVFDRPWLTSQHMSAFLSVARGSCAEPLLVQCQYRGAPPTTPPVLIAAKGVTFDSGGMCLKSADHMSENRGSMAGAAVVFAALKIIATLKVPINVVAAVPMCENMVSGQCMKVGDVVRALNGLSIQIEDTDLEGRLMMADALVYGQFVHKPSLVMDVATLTRGVLLATGGGAFGCFTNSEPAWDALRASGGATGDRPWRFPLWNFYHKQITNDPSVDLRNKGSGKATACIGAAFLKNFVCSEWVHMDITGVGKVAHAAAPPYLRPQRMAGRPTRTLALMLESLATHTAPGPQ